MVSLYSWISKNTTEKLVNRTRGVLFKEENYLREIKTNTNNLQNKIRLLINKLYYLTESISVKSEKEIRKNYQEIELEMNETINKVDKLITEIRLGEKNLTKIFKRLRKNPYNHSTIEVLKQDENIENAIANKSLTIKKLYTSGKQIFEKEMNYCLDHNETDKFNVKNPFPHL